MKGMQNNAQRNQPEHDTQKRSGAMRNLQETHSPHRDLQSVSAGHSDGDQIRESDLRGTREEVKFSLKAPVEDGARFSLRSTENIIRENAALQKENDLLQQRLSFWKSQVKRSERLQDARADGTMGKTKYSRRRSRTMAAQGKKQEEILSEDAWKKAIDTWRSQTKDMPFDEFQTPLRADILEKLHRKPKKPGEN